MNRMAAFALVIASFVVGGCHGWVFPVDPDPSTPTAKTLVKTRWCLQSITTPDSAKYHVRSSGSAYILMDTSGAAIGAGGCNTFTASFTSTDSTLGITGLTATNSVCDSTDTLEAVYFKALRSAKSYMISGGILTMWYGDSTGYGFMTFNNCGGNSGGGRDTTRGRSVGTQFGLGFNATVTFQLEPIVITLADLKDDRCPDTGNCSETDSDDAVVDLLVDLPDMIHRVSLHTNAGRGNTVIKIGPYTIKLVALTPAPVIKKKHRKEECSVTLIVLKD